MHETYRYLVMAMDPVHVGTGGMRLGRVDNTIVREPGTNLPKIPGTAIHGAIRAYAAKRFGKFQCAGQKGHCGQPTCPICYTFGSISGQRSYSGVVSITDARILLFPVYSMVGPVWVSTKEILEEVGFEIKNTNKDNDEEKKSQDSSEQKGKENKEKEVFLSTIDLKKPLNLGWLMIDAPKKIEISPPQNSCLSKNNSWDQIKDRVVLVSDKLFSQIVNSNLEVRTSVAINPETGAAEEGALFTYEAIPRSTIMWFDVIVDDFRGKFHDKKEWEKISSKYNIAKDLPDDMPEGETNGEKLLRELGNIDDRPEDYEKKSVYWEKVKSSFESFKEVMEKLNWSNPIDIVNLGIEWLPHLGLGGMGTRGFGRVKEIACLKLNQDGTHDGKCSENASHGETEK